MIIGKGRWCGFMLGFVAYSATYGLPILAFIAPLNGYCETQQENINSVALKKLREIYIPNLELISIANENEQIRVEGRAQSTKVIADFLHKISESNLGFAYIRNISQEQANGLHTHHFVVLIDPQPNLGKQESVVTRFSLADQVAYGPNDDDLKFSWGRPGNTFNLSAHGNLALSSNSSRPVRLPVEKGNWINVLKVARYQANTLLLYETTNNDSGWGHMCEITQTPKVIWCQTIPSISLTAAVGRNAVYVGGVRFIGKINPEKNGQYLWKIDNLGESANSNCVARENDSSVFFHTATLGLNGRPANEIEVDQAKGIIKNTSPITWKDDCN